MDEIKKAIEIMQTEKKCIIKNINGCDRMCQNCELVKTDSELLLAYDTTISVLEKQLNGAWIPVSERLPDEGTKVLVVSNNDIPIYCVAIIMNGELRVTWNHDRFEHVKIVAWQPLPEPYMEVEP